MRLALFAEMMKGKPWTRSDPERRSAGAGASASRSWRRASRRPPRPPAHRYHQPAARAVLQALLPESGTDIKGHMRSYADLLEASGYAGRRQDFDDLIRILDAELRLITPTDPEGTGRADEAVPELDPARMYYQLTHDYLVHSLRDWLTRKQRETRKGRAELRLAERSQLWSVQAREPLPALDLGMGQHPALDQQEGLDRSPARDDEAGGADARLVRAWPRWS